MENGWIKLHRKVLLNPINQRSAYFHLWVTLLLKANHEPTKMMWNKGIIVVKEGQMITGRNKLSEETGIPPSTIEDILNYLESQHQIQQQKNTKFRLITIVNWKDYQQIPTAKATTSRQQADTNKNVKNIKNNTIVAEATEEFSLKREIQKMEESPRRDINIIALYLEKKKPDIRNKQQLSIAIKRHLRPAKELTAFDDNQILLGCDKAAKQTPEWVLETVVKMLTK